VNVGRGVGVTVVVGAWVKVGVKEAVGVMVWVDVAVEGTTVGTGAAVVQAAIKLPPTMKMKIE